MERLLLMRSSMSRPSLVTHRRWSSLFRSPSISSEERESDRLCALRAPGGASAHRGRPADAQGQGRADTNPHDDRHRWGLNFAGPNSRPSCGSSHIGLGFRGPRQQILGQELAGNIKAVGSEVTFAIAHAEWTVPVCEPWSVTDGARAMDVDEQQQACRGWGSQPDG